MPIKKEQPLINKKHSLAVKLDRNTNTLLLYDFKEGNILEETEGILNEINEEIGLEIEAHFKISLLDCDVVLVKE